MAKKKKSAAPKPKPVKMPAVKKPTEKRLRALKKLQAFYAKVPNGGFACVGTSRGHLAIPTTHLKTILRALEVFGSVGAAKEALEAAEILIKRELAKKPLSAEDQKRLDEYIDKLPKAIPEGKILVHNHVKPNKVLGRNGFRAWITDHDQEEHILCSCDWAKRLGWHYRMRRAADQDTFIGLFQGD